jgi:hypothetical protein
LRIRLGFPWRFPARSAACADLHALRLTNSSTFVALFSQDEAVKPQPTLNPPELSDIEDLRLRLAYHLVRSLLNSAFGAIPLASGFKRLFAARFLAPVNNLRCRRLLTRLHLRSQQPITFQLSLFATGPCSIETLGFVSRQNQPCGQLLSDETAGSNRLFQASIPLRRSQL